MAAQRTRIAGVSGKLDAALAAADTTISGPGLADLPVIDAAAYVPLSLFVRDATSLRITQREVVWVTAHAAGATTATVLRAQEGTTAKTWAIGDQFAVALTAADLPPLGRIDAPNSAETSVDEFVGSALHADWVRVDPGVATNHRWSQVGGRLVAEQLGGTDPGGELHCLLRPIGAAMAIGDAFVTCTTLFPGSYPVNYTMGGLVVADGAVPTSNIAHTLHFITTGAGAVVDTRGGTIAASASASPNMQPIPMPRLFNRLVLAAAGSWRTDISFDGETWLIGAAFARALTPTHVGFLNSSWGSAVKGAVHYEFLRRVAGVA